MYPLKQSHLHVALVVLAMALCALCAIGTGVFVWIRDLLIVDGFGWYDGGGAYDGGRCAVSDDLSFVVYSTPKTGRGDIWKMAIEGGTEKRLTQADLFESDVALSPDGSSFIFGRESASGKQLWKYDLSTGHMLQISHPPLGGFDYKPCWRDDSIIQFVRYPNGIGRDPAFELWEVDLVRNHEYRVGPAIVWSDPDIGFLVTYDWESRAQRSIVRQVRNGETVAQVSIEGGDIAISPKGESFAYIGIPGRRSLWIYDWRTKSERQVWKPKGYLGIPSYSPSGRWITVMDYDSGDSFATVVVIDSSNQKVVKTVDVD